MFSIGDSEEPSGVDDGFTSPARPCEVALLKLWRLCFFLLEIRETHLPLAPCSAGRLRSSYLRVSGVHWRRPRKIPGACAWRLGPVFNWVSHSIQGLQGPLTRNICLILICSSSLNVSALSYLSTCESLIKVFKSWDYEVILNPILWNFNQITQHL